MLPVKRNHVYRTNPAQRRFFATVLLAMLVLNVAAMFNSWHETVKINFAISAIWVVGVLVTLGLFYHQFWGTVLTLGPDGLWLRERGRTRRLRFDDIQGRRKMVDEEHREVDVIVALSPSSTSITIPWIVTRDDFYRLWLHSLPELD